MRADLAPYLRNGGKVVRAHQMASNESPRTTGLYDRRDDEVPLYEIERIVICLGMRVESPIHRMPTAVRRSPQIGLST